MVSVYLWLSQSSEDLARLRRAETDDGEEFDAVDDDPFKLDRKCAAMNSRKMPFGCIVMC